MGRARLELGLGSSSTSINLDLSIYKEISGRKLVHCIISNCCARLHDPLVRNPYKSDPNRALVHAFSFACITHLLQFFLFHLSSPTIISVLTNLLYVYRTT